MNVRLIFRLLGRISLLVGATMLFSMPWAMPGLGIRSSIQNGPKTASLQKLETIEWNGLIAIGTSMIVCIAIGGLFIWFGRKATGKLFRKETMAVVGLSWMLATVLGALPFYFSSVQYCPAVRIGNQNERPQVFNYGAWLWRKWSHKEALGDNEYIVVQALDQAGSIGLSREQLVEKTSIANAETILRKLSDRDPDWNRVIVFPGSGPPDRANHIRIAWVPMGLVDCLFESQSGFSTTGATVISNVEDPVNVPHCILFWRSSTHFLGGLGIIVLFVVILGQGSAGKSLMRAEMAGPSQESSTPRTQQTAWIFAGMYCGLTLILTLVLWLEGMSLFDALCHAFGTVATGGFSTYNESVGHFNSPAIESTIIVFMVLAGTNFTLLVMLVAWRPKFGKLLRDVEWRAYIGLIIGVTAIITLNGVVSGVFETTVDGIRFSLFEVVAIITTTGYGIHDFDKWTNFGRGILLMLMFVGGCAGSTAGGLKVIRHVLFAKILCLEIEHAYRPRVVRLLKLGGKPVDDPSLRRSLPVYFGVILLITAASWLILIAVEPNTTWGTSMENKLIDSASAVAATLNNIGPGLGVVGTTNNYAYFTPFSKLLFVMLMMVGRLEVFAVLVIFIPGFWRGR